MSKFTKSFTMATPKGSLAEDVANAVRQSSDEQGRGMELMRQWIKGGYVLDQLGHGILHTLLDMAENPRFKNLTEQQVAHYLQRMLEQTVWLDELMVQPEEPAKTAREVATQQPVVEEYRGEDLSPRSEPALLNSTAMTIADFSA